MNEGFRDRTEAGRLLAERLREYGDRDDVARAGPAARRRAAETLDPHELHGRWLVVLDGRDAWSEHQPSAGEENEFIAQHGWDAYGRWHLGVDDERPNDTKGHWKFPYGDFKDIHRCAVLSAESRDYDDIKTAIAHLHGMLETLRTSARTA